ncbi:type VI secretion system-associated protein, partial [Serratia marcescens]|nr:type VI secretion system-associated protein [Serratia marcescens]
LSFEPKLHAWAFNGEAIVGMPRVDAADENKIKQRLQQAQTAWQPLLSAPAPLTFKLVEKLAADRVDPASGSYLSVNGATH